MKRINYLSLHGRKVRTNGNTYRFISYLIGTKQLCSAECICGPKRGHVILDFIHDRCETVRCLKNGIKFNLFV